MRTWLNDVEVLAPQTWIETTPPEPGSWWPVWEHWLAQHSSAVRVNPPQFGAAAAGYLPIADAPGEYVLQK